MTRAATWAWTRASLLAAFAIISIVLLGLLAWGPGAGQPHDVPTGVNAPGIAGQMIAETYGDGQSALKPTTVDEFDSVADDLRDQQLVGVVKVDLAHTKDTIYVDGSRDPRLVEAVIQRVTQLENTLGRSMEVEDAAPPSARGQSGRIDNVAVLASLTGLILGIIAVARKWVPHRRVRRVPRPLLVLAPASFVAGLLGAFLPWSRVDLPWWWAAVFLGLTVLTIGLLTAALAVAGNLYGVGVATVIALIGIAPALAHVDVHLMGQPWRFSHPLTATGALRQALIQMPSGFPVQELFVLLAWLVSGLVATWVSLRRGGEWRAQLPLTRTAAAALPAAVLLLGAALLLPDPSSGNSASELRATSTECVRTGSPKSVDDLNHMIDTLDGSPQFQGGDVGASVLLQDARSLWFFGDTVREKNSQGGEFVRNSMLLFDSDCISVVLPPGQGAAIPDRSDGVGYWPMSVKALPRPGYDLVAVTAQRVHSTGDGVWDFETLGPAVAVFVVPTGGTPQLLGRYDLGRDNTDTADPMWGAATATDGEWLYLYGTAKSAEESSLGHSLRVARMKPDNVARQESWDYWDGTDWVKSESDAAELIPQIGGTSQTLSVFEQNGQWYALSKRDDYLGHDIVIWKAPSPQGPFAAQPPVAYLPSNLATGEIRYMPLAHPDVFPEPGTMVISYSNNRENFGEVLADPRTYRPRFLRVALP